MYMLSYDLSGRIHTPERTFMNEYITDNQLGYLEAIDRCHSEMTLVMILF
jgi:hypothetical protein